MALKQASRLLNLKTPLGDDVLLLTGFTGEEGLSQLFRFTLDMISDKADVAGKDILGKGVTFSVRLADDSLRHFHGMVSRFSAGDEDENGRRGYRAEVVPWLWFLTRNSDCRIFQKMAAPDIIQQIFKDRGFSDFQLKLQGNHPKREYCVQHQETDFNFVSRLMEEEGIFYFFEHADGKHKMILGDKATAYIDSKQKEVDYPFDFGTLAAEDHIRSWEHSYEFRTGKVAQTDYNFETPSTNLATNANTVVSVPGNTKFEFFEYPGIYVNKGDGQPLTDVRMEEEEAGHDVVIASSIVRAMTPGGKFKIRQHRAATEKGKSYVVTRVSHSAREILGYETGGGSAGYGYENSFTCIPDSVTYRPPRVTRKPRVDGIQTAIVVGPGGEEIYPDKYGRVKVQFHWDRYGKKDENSSCWIRVSQIHAGKGFGGIDIPRIGDEVIVSFPNGDPDQPIITGRLYHAENMPPFGLPGAKTVSGLKTKTYKGDGYNELALDDTPGNELIRIHGQFDMDSTIEHDLREHVLRDRSRDVTRNETILIGNDQTSHIKANRTETVDKNEKITVHGNRAETVDKDETITIHGIRTEKVDKDESISIGGSRVEQVSKDESVTISGKRSKMVSKDESIAVSGNRVRSVGKNENVTVSGNREKTVSKNETQTITENLTIKVGGNELINIAKSLNITAGEEISLTTGKATLVMKKDGSIQINGKDITIAGSGVITGKATKDLILKGKNILHN